MAAEVAHQELGNKSNLTASQLMMWTGQKTQPNDPLYNMVLAFHISGDVDRFRFAQALQHLINTSDAMRTVITERDGVPNQRVLKKLHYDLPYLDFSAGSAPQTSFADWVEARSRRPLVLSERLFDTALVKLGNDSFVWYFNQHHVITDAWSVSLIFRAVGAIYEQAQAGTFDQAEARPQFTDYAADEPERRGSRRFAKAAEYWRNQLSSVSPPLSFYRTAPTAHGGETHRTTCSLGSRRTKRLRELARQPQFRAMSEDLSLFQIFATILAAYLHRICQVEYVVLGTPAHNRTSQRLKETIGPLFDMFPVRTNVDAGMSFSGLNRRLAQDTRQMLLHAAPGSCSVDAARRFNVVLNYITAAFGKLADMPVTSNWIHAGAGDRNHVLRLQVHDFDRDTPGRDDEIVLHFDTNVHVFVDDDCDQLVRHFLALADAMLEDPDQIIATVPLVDQDDASAQVEALRGRERDAPTTPVITLFEARAAAEPDAVAAVAGPVAMSYRELDQTASAVAARLTALGTRPGQRAAIAATRSLDSLAAILGCLKIGVAYVPIDPGYPRQRIRTLLRGADLAVVLSQQTLIGGDIGAEAAAADLHVIAIDDIDRTLAQTTATATLEDDAYIIHTSGSTGVPKGVIVGHRALANYVTWAARQYVDQRLGAERCVFPLFTSLGFDLTVTSIFVPLITGGTVVVYEERSGGREITLQRVIEENRVNIIKLTPAHLSLMQAMDLSGSRIRTLILGGEDLKTDLARNVVRRLDNAVIYNEYGPTEATVGCTVHRFNPSADTGVSVPIGRAIDNAEIYLLDPAGHPVPRGVAGELFVGGAGLARGYLNNPEATARSFVLNVQRPGELMYATGDRARLAPDATLEYLGRNDHQVKIRGVRVELGEIEAALMERPSINDAVVLAVDPVQATDNYCIDCGLDARHPDAHLDQAGVCRLCRVFAEDRESALAYFGTMHDLKEIANQTRLEARGEHDCLMLLSGGKDSSYALCQLAALGFRPLVFTLDNGYISEQAMANARRIVDKLSLELVVGRTSAMNEIFVDSLTRFSNVCNGCFKTIYTLSMSLAHERGIKTIFTGLSRGQIFETRLAEFFKQRIFDPDQIDRLILEARKVYHRMDDAVCRSLDVSIFEDDAIFDEIRFIDFYRYCDATLDEVYAYLGTEAPWLRPNDTGRSTNCLINEVGIHVHKTERGFHNYALPYSWDVRLGHKERNAAREELDDEINSRSVVRILGEIGYEIAEIRSADSWQRRLVAYYVAPEELPLTELKTALAERLPEELLPHQFVRLNALPLTANGKVDRDALPKPESGAAIRAADYVAPRNSIELELACIWENVLGVDGVGIHDDFFDLGGDSILNIQIVARARVAGLVISPEQIFEHTTIADLALVAGNDAIESEQGVVTGEVPLLPIQRRFFEEAWSSPDQFSQVVFLETAEVLDVPRLRKALEHLLAHHDGLRSRFERSAEGWRQIIQGLDAIAVAVDTLDLADVPPHDRQSLLRARSAELCRGFDIHSGRLVRVLCANDSQKGHIVIAIHHLVVDAVSWWVILADLESAYLQLERGVDVRLPPKTTSLAAWSLALAQWSLTKAAAEEARYWSRLRNIGITIPRDRADGRNTREASSSVSVALTRRETESLLGEVARAQRVLVPEVLLTALSIAFSRSLDGLTAASHVRVDLEGHGREELTSHTDLLRTTGWFTSLYPVCLPLDGSLRPVQLLRRVREMLRATPTHGVGYGALRYLSDNQQTATSVIGSRAELLFNYLGQWDKTLSASNLFSLAGPIEIAADETSERPYLVEINAVVFRGQLKIDWIYSERHHLNATIQGYANGFVDALRKLIEESLSNPDTSLAPSDFPDAGMSQEDLDALLAELGEDNG